MAIDIAESFNVPLEVEPFKTKEQPLFLNIIY